MIPLYWDKNIIFACSKQPAGLPLTPQGGRGKSGQHRASYFLTESHPRGWSNAEENNRHAIFFAMKKIRGKGEKAG